MDVNKYYLVIITLFLCYKNVLSNKKIVTVSEKQGGNSSSNGASSDSGSGSGDTIDTPMLDSRDLCPPGLNDVKSYLCHSVKALVSEFPGGGAATYFMDLFFTTGDNSEERWNEIKANVENYVAEQMEERDTARFKRWHESLIDSVTACKRETILSEIIHCYKLLKGTLVAYEAHIKGSNMKNRALYYKYYEFFVTTYLSVCDKLIDIADAATVSSVKSQVRRKAASFATYLEGARDDVLLYGCRIIKIRIEGRKFSTWEFIAYSPENVMKKKARRFMKNQLKNGLLEKRTGCGPGKKSRWYQAFVYNRKTEEHLSKAWYADECSDARGIAASRVHAFDSWLSYWGQCRKRIRKEFANDMLTLIGILKNIASA